PDAGTAEPGSELSLTSDGDRQMLDEWFGTLSQRWGKARETAVSPASMSIATHAGGDSPELIAAGEALFHDVQRANCVKCHGPAGTGGVPLRDMDDWNKRRQGFVDATELLAAAAETRRAAAQSAPPAYRQQSFAQLRPLEQQVDERRGVAAAFLPPVTARPRRIAGGVLRGGGDRLAVAIHEGIAGTPMPGIGATSSPQDVAALAAYVRFLLQRDQSEGAL
ncbi:MAG: c-type cytochrome, partial [Planctomycetota bacterium]